jgi:adenine-specific DNA-methyltransferase
VEGDIMANLSQKKWQRMLAFLNTLKEKNANDDDTLIAINEVENALNEKKYGLVWERHEEAVDVKMKTHIPVFTEDKDMEIEAAPGDPYNFLIV